MNTSRSKAALFDVRATDSNHDIFHTADKTDTRRHSLTGRKHHAQCLLTKPYYVHSTKPIRLRMERTVSQTLRQTRGEGNTKRFKQNQRKNTNRTRSPHATLSSPHHLHNKQKDEKKERKHKQKKTKKRSNQKEKRKYKTETSRTNKLTKEIYGNKRKKQSSKLL